MKPQNNRRLYSIWNGMKGRCYNPKNPSYKNYGQRGIGICDEWLVSFECFKKWALENGYDEKDAVRLSIERIDVNQGYFPENCRFIPLSEQNENRRVNHMITLGNVTRSVGKWEKELGLKPGSLYRNYVLEKKPAFQAIDDASKPRGRKVPHPNRGKNFVRDYVRSLKIQESV